VRERGFSIIELMFAVGILGILATLATTQLLKFTHRTRQSEVKTMLGAVAKAERVYRADADTYTDNLSLLGWHPDGKPVFLIGFSTDAVPAASGCNDTAECLGGFSVTKMVDSFGVPLTGALLPVSPVTPNRFTIGAVGNLDTDADLDTWTLDDSGQLTHVVNDID
jgi:prepilin-type N-terminal cleavage/methylation domain-containing protein